MTPNLYIVPYDSGHRGLRMGAGPLRLRSEFDFPAEEIEPDTSFTLEIGTAFQLYRNLAKRIEGFPVVLSGNCGSAIGTAAGLGMNDLAVIWFDAHGDFNTPETSRSGFLDGMALSILTGRCFQPLASTIRGFTPLPFDRVLYAGGHALDASETADFKRYRVPMIRPGDEIPPLNAERILIHIDVDVLDIKHGRANPYACAGGMSPADVLQIIEACAAQLRIAGIVIASYDPSCDEDGRIATAATTFVKSALSFC